jgi:hypothetical protein
LTNLNLKVFTSFQTSKFHYKAIQQAKINIKKETKTNSLSVVNTDFQYGGVWVRGGGRV